MGNQSGSILIQALVNLLIYSFFLVVSVQGMRVLSQPFRLDEYKVAYVQLQLDYLSELYQGVEFGDRMCFVHDLCLEYRHQRIIFTPGHQILLENIEQFTVIDQDQRIIMSFKFQGIKRELHVHKK